MSYDLIISEKPNAAKKIAESLADGKPLKETVNGVPVYKLTHNKKDVVVACAVGHLFTVAEVKKSFKYPSFDIHWVPTADIDKSSAFSQKYLTTIKKLSKDASTFTVACDYDIEGEVIGLNIVRFACNQKDASRMKFSTLTKDELNTAYDKRQKTLDWGQANAGETRHFLDWLYGINLSRALMTAVKTAGSFKVLSSGRVQGPALKILVDKEKEIKAFTPTPYWQLELRSKKDESIIVSSHKEDKFLEEAKADAVLKKCLNKDAQVSDIKKKSFQQAPPVPFDLGGLQTESYRLFGIAPKQTLQIAQNLYLEGATSYPRTSSQKLPKELGFDKILKSLAKKYPKQTKYLLSLPKLTPNEGKKSDPAHPAIYPTGQGSKSSDEREMKVYDLIVKRFFAVFGEAATRETVTATLEIEKEPFIAKGTTTLSPGWHTLYEPYVRLKEELLPALRVGETLATVSLEKLSKETTPPKRYTASSIINELEKRGLGTKATRADIVESLYNRGYVDEKSITASELGIRTIETLEKYCPEIIDEELTRSIEQEMKDISDKNTTPKKVLDHAKIELEKTLQHFKKNEKLIGQELILAERETQDIKNTMGPCPACAGYLMIKYSPKNKKKFIGCSNYPECETTAPLPAGAIIKSTEKVCEHDSWPMVQVLRRGARPQEICLNIDCPSKINPELKEKEGLPCPKCGKPMVIKKTLYGGFVGCSDYPKCKHIEKNGK